MTRTRMRAMEIDGFGGPGVLRRAEAAPGRGEVLVRVASASLILRARNG